MISQPSKGRINHPQSHIIKGCSITAISDTPNSMSSNENKEDRSDHPHKSQKQPMGGRCCRSGVVTLIILVALAAVFVGVVYIQGPMTRLGFIDGQELTRKSRTPSNPPDSTRWSPNHTPFHLLTLLKSSGPCNDSHPQNCQTILPCNTTKDKAKSCTCSQGFYLKNRQCIACIACGPTQYEIFPCSTTDNTVCIDVSFPVGALAMNRSYLPDDGRSVTVTHSSNVFVERLIEMDALETPMYVTNNQQSLDFVWPRPSGLDIAVSVSDVYLVPDYDDAEAIDDTALFHRLIDPSQKMKYYYNYVQSHYCRHPVPDYYSIQLEVMANRTATAQVIRCDSQDDSVPRCPLPYKDGDRYLKWNINSPCPTYMTSRLSPLKDGPNSVVCTDETDLLRKMFQRVRPTTQEYMFPSRECETLRRKCEQCLKTAVCPTRSASTNESYLDDNQCCGIHCYSQTACLKTFSKNCPVPTVECATGEVNIFSRFPHFDSGDRQFSCHIKYAPRHQLFSVRYVIKVPTINFNTTSHQFTVVSNSRSEHERRLSQFDFITAFHDTRIKIEDSLILIGDHNELKHHQESLMKPYKVREIKSPSDLSKEKAAPTSPSAKAVYVQFEKPFLYSSYSWYKDGCSKNISQIYPNQTIYKDDFTPIIARKGRIEVSPETTHLKPQGFTYRLYHRDRAPYIKFFVEKGKSVLQHLQGKSAKGKLLADSLTACATWHNKTSNWKISFSATQDVCPSVISIKIFTQMFTACVAHFDLLINCPTNFTVTFNFPLEPNNFPNIFILQVNDSAATHNVILSLLSPIREKRNSKTSSQLQTAFPSYSSKNSLIRIWIFVILILILTILILIVNCVCFKYINLKTKRVFQINVGNLDGKMFDEQEEKAHKTGVFSRNIRRERCFLVAFVLLYILYSIVFTFSLGFGIVYVTHYSIWSDATNIEINRETFLTEFNKSLREIKQFEDDEKSKLIASFNERKDSCLVHLKNENRKQVLEYEATTQKQLEIMFSESGQAHFFTREIQKRNFSIYLNHIRGFVVECNKTISSIVERFQANFYLFVRNTVHNDWLRVPRQIFLHQDGENPDMRFLSSTQVKQFATWLEIDKAEELFVAKENVFGRLSSVQNPETTAKETSFPSVQPQMMFGNPEPEIPSPSHYYNVLGPLFPHFENPPSFDSETKKPPLKLHPRAVDSDPDMFQRDQQQQQDIDKSTFHEDQDKASEIPEESTTIHSAGLNNIIPEKFTDVTPGTPNEINLKKLTEKISEELVETAPERHLSVEEKNENSESRYNFVEGTKSATNMRDNDHEKSDELRVLRVNLMNDEIDETSTSEMLLDSPSVSSNSERDESKKTENKSLYVMIASFLIFDVVLWAHRIWWLRTQIHAARKGFSVKVPNDDVCEHLLEIQTAKKHSFTDESSRYFLGENVPFSETATESGVIFLKDLKVKRSKNESLQDIWREKTRKDGSEVKIQKPGWRMKVRDLKRRLRYFCLSNIVWQSSVTFLAVTFICVIVYCVENCFTPQSLRSLLGGRSTAADLMVHMATSDRYLQLLAQRLTGRLQQIKEMSDLEVQLLTEIYFKTLNMQTSMFTEVLQKLCSEAKGNNCDKLIAYHSAGERIVGCNFLPLQAKSFLDLNLPRMETIVTGELTSQMNIFHHTLMVSASVLIFLLCSRLLCQATALLLKHFLLITGRLPRVRIIQTEKAQLHVPEDNGTTMQRSQSWVDSCESGVYLGETEDVNKEDNNR